MVVVTETRRPFANGDLVQIETSNVRAFARVRSVEQGRVHIALEQGEYLPWVEEPVTIRRSSDRLEQSSIARVVHTSSASATLELLGASRGAMDTLPLSERFDG